MNRSYIDQGGYTRTLLGVQNTTVYEPRNTFQLKHKEELTKTMNNAKGHLVHYHTNGSGRDEYIYKDSGGFNKMYEPVKYAQVGSM